jgi:hypothetical protein
MKKFLAIIFLLAVLFGIWYLFFNKKVVTEETKQESLNTNTKHSAAFNRSVTTTINKYLDVKSAFVEADTFAIKATTRKFISAVDTIKVDELKKDSAAAIYPTAVSQRDDIKSNATAILGDKDVTEMRKDFKMVSENLYPFLKTIKYEGQKLYWENCPMAFGEGKDASWISNSNEIVNPYLGKNHPEYKGTMLHCGEIKDSIQ